MCGIAGAFDLTGRREFPEERLLLMTGALAHRGPNDEYVHCEPGVALGVRRLSVIDVANGRQPLSNESGDVLGGLRRRAVRVPRPPRATAGARPSAVDALRHRGVGPPVRRPRRKGLRAGARPVRRFAVGPQPPHRISQPRSHRHQPAVLRRGGRLAAVGFRDQEPARFRSDFRPAGRARTGLFLQLLLPADEAHGFRGRPFAAAGPLPPRSRGPADAPALLGPRFPRSRNGAPLWQRRQGGRGPGVRAARRRPPPAVRRGASQLLHQRRTRFDDHSRTQLAGERRADPVAHHQPQPFRSRRRAQQGGGVGPLPRLEADRGDGDAGRPHQPFPGRDPRRGRPGAGHVLRGDADAGRGQPPSGQHRRPDRRGGRRGAGRLRLVQVEPLPAIRRLLRPICRPIHADWRR